MNGWENRVGGIRIRVGKGDGFMWEHQVTLSSRPLYNFINSVDRGEKANLKPFTFILKGI